jgi:hypothetical protein
MKPLLSAWLYAHDNGVVEWTIRSHPTAEDLGLTPLNSGGRVKSDDPVDGSRADPEDIGIALGIVGARLVGLSCSAAWSHNMF